MKRIMTLLLAAGLVVSAAMPSQAADIKISGAWDFNFESSDASFGVGHGDSDDFKARQCLGLQFDIIASESLRGVVAFEIGDTTWGLADSEAAGDAGGGQLGADGKVVTVTASFIDWTVPDSDMQIRMGIQPIALPGAVAGSPILDDDMAGIVISNSFSDEFALTAFWTRLYDGGFDGKGEGDDEMDMFALTAPITFDGHEITPYFAYATIGDKAVNEDGDSPMGAAGDAYFAGVAYTMTAFDPLTVNADFIYGSLDAEHDSADDQDGWLFAVSADYALDAMTPGLVFWYGTGNDDGDNGMLPTVSPAFGVTTYGFDGAFGSADGAMFNATPAGTWGIVARVADMSFIEDMSHCLNVAYYQGTNETDSKFESEAVELNKDDSAWEVNFDTQYQIYENLTLAVELAYINIDAEHLDIEDAYKCGVNFSYEF